MEWLAIGIAVFACLILLIFFREETTWFEYGVVLGPTIIIILLLKTIIVGVQTSDVEYFGSYATGVKYYEPWDEWVHRTCTRTIGSGKSQRTISYDCSYRQYHGPKWVMTTSDGDEEYIDQTRFNNLVNQWKTPRQFIELNRHYYTQDGDAYYYEWNEKAITSVSLTHGHTYNNKVKASQSIFNYEDIDEDEAKSLGLYDYPEVFCGYQPVILGHHKFSPYERKLWDFLNGYYGKKYQFRSYLIFFYNKSQDVVNKQMSYWKGPNKNEMLIFVGIDSSSRQVQWCDIRSWSDKPELEVHTRDYVMDNFEGKQLNIPQLYTYVFNRVPGEWHRKEFKDFNYLSIELSGTSIFWISFIVLIYVVVASAWVICNNFRN